jgi:PAS domain S-box-containing protein
MSAVHLVGGAIWLAIACGALFAVLRTRRWAHLLITVAAVFLGCQSILAWLYGSGVVTGASSAWIEPSIGLANLVAGTAVLLALPMALLLRGRSAAARRRARSAQSDELLRERIDALPFPVAVSSRDDGTILHCNRAFGEFVGVPPEEAIGDRATRFYLDPAARDRMLAQLERLGRVRGFEIAVRRDGDESVWGAVSFDPIDFAGQSALFSISVDVTARKKAERDLEDSRRLLQLVSDNTPAMLYLLDVRARRYVFANGRVTEFFGVDVTSLGERTDSFLRDHIHPEDWSRHEHALESLGGDVTHDRIVERVMRVRDRSGSWRWVHTRDQIYDRDADGRARTIIGVAIDITEKRQADEALRATEGRLGSVMHHAPGFFYELDHDATVHYANRTITGLPADKIVGTCLFDSLAPGNGAELREALNAVFERGDSPVREFPLHAPSGEVRWYAAHFGPIGTDERIERAILIIHDITARRTVEDALRQSEVRYRAIVESQTELVCRATPDGVITFVNDAYCRYFEKSSEELIGSRWLPLVSEEDRAAAWGGVCTLAPDNVTADLEHRVIRPDGSYAWMQWSNRAILDADGEIVEIQAVGRDITERKRTEEFQSKLEAELRHVQKLEAVSTLATGVAHDFNNLLMAILNANELAQNSLPPDHAARSRLDLIEEACRQAEDVIRSLMMFARHGRGERSRVDLSRLIRESMALLERLLPESIELTERVPDDGVVWIDADPNQLQQVLINLGLNARDAIEGDGRIAVTLNIARDPVVGSTNRAAVIEFEDTGTGMTPDVLPRVFEPFFTTKSRGHGTGLGLAVVHGIVTTHEGRIDVESSPDEGTRFTIRLPLLTGECPETQRGTTGVEAPASPSTVLVMARNAKLRSAVTHGLEEAGYEVVVADGADPVGLTVDQTPIALVVVDEDEAARMHTSVWATLREANPSLPVITLAAKPPSASIRDDERTMHSLAKPFSVDDLLFMVNDLLAEPSSSLEDSARP